MLERGVLAVVLSYERALPLLGLAAALAQLRRRDALAAAAFAVLGLWAGFAFREQMIAAVVSSSATAVRLALPGPLSSVAVGILLAAPPGLRPFLSLPAAGITGVMLAVAIKLIDPSFHDPGFVRGAVAAGIWLVAAAAIAGRLVAGAWAVIATRIFGSWLIAIGVMLAAAILIPRPSANPPPSQPVPLERPVTPEIDRPPAKDEPPAFPVVPPGVDPSRQL